MISDFEIHDLFWDTMIVYREVLLHNKKGKKRYNGVKIEFLSDQKFLKVHLIYLQGIE